MSSPKKQPVNAWVRSKNPAPKQPSAATIEKKANQRLRTLSYFGCNPNAAIAAKKAAGLVGGEHEGKGGKGGKDGMPKDPLLAAMWMRQREQRREIEEVEEEERRQLLEDEELMYHQQLQQRAPAPQPPLAPIAQPRRPQPPSSSRRIYHTSQPTQKPMTRAVPTMTTGGRVPLSRVESHDERYERDLRARLGGSTAWSNAVRPLRL